MIETKKDTETTAKPVEEVVRLTTAKVEAEQTASAGEIRTGAVTAAETEATPAKKVPTRKTAAKKAPTKTTTTKKEPVKKDIVKRETVRREAEKEGAEALAKKTVAKKTGPKAEVHFWLDGKGLVAKDVLDHAVKAYESNHKGVEIKTTELYTVANESTAYCVVSGEANDDFKVVL